MPNSVASERVKADDASLARDVMNEVGHKQADGIRRDVDDAAPACSPHAASKRLGHQEHRIEIDGEDAAPVVKADLVEGLQRINAGIVDEDVAARTAPLDRLLQRIDTGRIADVAREGCRLAANICDHLQRVVSAVTVSNDDAGPFLGKPYGRSLPDPRRRAGNDDGFAFVSSRH